MAASGDRRPGIMPDTTTAHCTAETDHRTTVMTGLDRAGPRVHSRRWRSEAVPTQEGHSAVRHVSAGNAGKGHKNTNN